MKRLILPLLAALLAGPAISAPAPTKQYATVRVSGSGYTPASLTLKPGIPAEITFLRETEGGCVGEILIPELGLRKKLPLKQPVKVEFTPTRGKFDFTCAMKMVKGTIVVP